MLYSTVAQVGFVAMVAVGVFTLATGDRWGRLSSVLHVANWLLVYAFQRGPAPGFPAADFLIDIVGAMLALWIASSCGRAWAVALAAFQILGVANYLPQLIDWRISGRAFVSASYVWEAGALLSLFAGGVDELLRRLSRPHDHGSG